MIIGISLDSCHWVIIFAVAPVVENTGSRGQVKNPLKKTVELDINIDNKVIKPTYFRNRRARPAVNI
jgi:hypothetical protein